MINEIIVDGETLYEVDIDIDVPNSYEGIQQYHAIRREHAEWIMENTAREDRVYGMPAMMAPGQKPTFYSFKAAVAFEFTFG